MAVPPSCEAVPKCRRASCLRAARGCAGYAARGPKVKPRLRRGQGIIADSDEGVAEEPMAVAVAPLPMAMATLIRLLVQPALLPMPQNDAQVALAVGADPSPRPRRPHPRRDARQDGACPARTTRRLLLLCAEPSRIPLLALWIVSGTFAREINTGRQPPPTESTNNWPGRHLQQTARRSGGEGGPIAHPLTPPRWCSLLSIDPWWDDPTAIPVPTIAAMVDIAAKATVTTVSR